jgi:sulfhydrogenase subunit gamma (sulfur reductase)
VPSLTDNSYVPIISTIKSVRQLTPTEKMFEIELPEGKRLNHDPGQFVQMLVPGVGEAPISICSSPTDRNFHLTIRRVGNVTTAVHGMKEGDKLGIRGSFGWGFPMDKMTGSDILIIAGGIGLAPLRSVIRYILANRDEYGKFTILHGARTPSDRLFADELEQWSSSPSVNLLETVDHPDDSWDGNSGVITTLFKKIDVNPDNTFALICGPPVMYRFVILECQGKGLMDNHIFVSLERHMKCGMGKCGHCQINGVYTCQHGPVFSYTQVKNLEEAL